MSYTSTKIDLSRAIKFSDADLNSFSASSDKGQVSWQLEKNSQLWQGSSYSDFQLSAFDDFSKVFYSGYNSTTDLCDGGIVNADGSVTKFTLQASRTNCLFLKGNSVSGLQNSYIAVLLNPTDGQLSLNYSGKSVPVTGFEFETGAGFDFVARGIQDPTSQQISMQVFVYRIAQDYDGKYPKNKILSLNVDDSQISTYQISLYNSTAGAVEVQWVSCAFYGIKSPVLRCWTRILDPVDQKVKFRFLKRMQGTTGFYFKKVFDFELEDGVVGVDKDPLVGWKSYVEYDIKAKIVSLCTLDTDNFDVENYTKYKENCKDRLFDVNLTNGEYVSSVKVLDEKIMFTIKSVNNEEKKRIIFTMVSDEAIFPQRTYEDVALCMSKDFGFLGILPKYRVGQLISYTSKLEFFANPDDFSKGEMEEVAITLKDSEGEAELKLKLGFVEHFYEFDCQPFSTRLPYDAYFTELDAYHVNRKFLAQGDFVTAEIGGDIGPKNVSVMIAPFYEGYVPLGPIPENETKGNLNDVLSSILVDGGKTRMSLRTSNSIVQSLVFVDLDENMEVDRRKQN
jgi:hypothetical protein